MRESESVGTIAEICRENVDFAIGPLGRRDHRRRTNGAGQDKAIIIVGMFADQVHPARCTSDKIGRATELRDESCGNVVLECCVSRGQLKLR